MTEQQSSAIDAMLKGESTFAGIALPDLQRDKRYPALSGDGMQDKSVGDMFRVVFDLAHETIQTLFPGVMLAQWKEEKQGEWLSYHSDTNFRWVSILLQQKASAFVATVTFLGQHRARESMFAHDLDALLPRLAITVNVALTDLLEMQGECAPIKRRSK